MASHGPGEPTSQIPSVAYTAVDPRAGHGPGRPIRGGQDAAVGVAPAMNDEARSSRCRPKVARAEALATRRRATTAQETSRDVGGWAAWWRRCQAPRGLRCHRVEALQALGEVVRVRAVIRREGPALLRGRLQQLPRGAYERNGPFCRDRDRPKGERIVPLWQHCVFCERPSGVPTKGGATGMRVLKARAQLSEAEF